MKHSEALPQSSAPAPGETNPEGAAVPSRGYLRHIAAYGLYLLIAVIVTWPLLPEISTRLIGHPFSDAYEYIRHIWWFKYALENGQPLFYHPLLVYPEGVPGAWLWAIPLQSFPAWLFALVMPLPLAFNLTLLLRLALNGWAMYWLVRHLTGQTAAALLAGTIFLAYPTFQGHIGAAHIGLLVLWPVPLFIYALLRLEESRVPDARPPLNLPRQRGRLQLFGWILGSGDWRWLILAAVLFTLAALGSQVLLVFLLGPVTALLLLRHVARRDWRGLRQTVAAVLLGGLLLLIFLGPFLLETRQGGVILNDAGDVFYSADLLGPVTPSYEHPLFSHLPYTHTVLGIEPFERAAYIGLIAAVLAGIGLWRRPESRWWLLLALVAGLFALGPLLNVMGAPALINLGDYATPITLPWLLLQDLPLFNLTRTPARFNFAVGLAVALMAGYGAAVVLRRGRGWRWPLLLVLIAAILFEYRLFWPTDTINGVVPAPVRALAQRDDIRAVLNVAWRHWLVGKEAMFLQTGHEKPILTGAVARGTLADPAQITVLEDTFDLALLDAAGVDIVILHKEWAGIDRVLEDRARVTFGAPLYEDADYAVFEVPPPDAAPAFATALNALPRIEHAHDLYFYAPQPGWARLTGSLDGDGRLLTVALNGEPIAEILVTGPQTLDLPLPVPAAGYHTVTLALDPPCPRQLHPGLACRALTTDNLHIRADADGLGAPAQFAGGITLAGSHQQMEGNTMTVYLWWRFAEPRRENDIRLVHVVDADGNLIAQDDSTLGALPAGVGRVDVVRLTLPDDAADYTVYTGWYSYPDLTRYPVLDAVPGVSENRVPVGATSP